MGLGIWDRGFEDGAYPILTHLMDGAPCAPQTRELTLGVCSKFGILLFPVGHIRWLIYWVGSLVISLVIFFGETKSELGCRGFEDGKFR